MPFATAAGIAAIGAGVGAAGSIIGGSMQAGAVNSSSKSAQRIAEENRVVGQQNLNNTLAVVTPRLETGGGNATQSIIGYNENAASYLQNGYDTARQSLDNGFGTAGQRLGQAGLAATQYLDTGNQRIGQGVTQANALLDPYIQTGQRALGMTADLAGANGVDAGRAAMANFQHSPGYEFALDQGLRAVDAGASARGMLVSGTNRAAEMKYGQGLASQDFAAYYNRLSGLASQGLGASNTAGNNLMQGAQAQSRNDAALAATVSATGSQQASNDANWGGAMAGLATGMNNQLSSNAMTTGGRLATNDQTTAQNIANLYTNNAQQSVNLGTQTAANQAQTAASTGSSLASIYGNETKGVTSAINSGLNGYMFMNALSPQQQPTQQPPTYGAVY